MEEVAALQPLPESLRIKGVKTSHNLRVLGTFPVVHWWGISAKAMVVSQQGACKDRRTSRMLQPSSVAAEAGWGAELRPSNFSLKSTMHLFGLGLSDGFKRKACA